MLIFLEVKNLEEDNTGDLYIQYDLRNKPSDFFPLCFLLQFLLKQSLNTLNKTKQVILTW